MSHEMSDKPSPPQQPMEELTKKRGPLAWFASNQVAANLLMLFLLTAGAVTALTTRMEVFQEFETDMVTVSVPYLGATPAEVEDGVLLRVEEAIEGIEGIKRIRSTASEGVGAVTAELEDYANDQTVLDDIQSEVDRIDTFPEETEKPIVSDVVPRVQVLSIVLSGDVSERTLKNLAEQVRDELTALENISQVDINGVRDFEISIEMSEETLRRYGLTFEKVADAVRRSSLDLPGGTVKTEGGEILIRTKGQRYVGPEFEKTVVLTRPDGTEIRLGEIAEVIDGFEDTDVATYFDGRRAVLLKVFRVGEQDALDVAGTVKEYVKDKAEQLPAGISIDTWFDRSIYLKGRVELLVRNGMIGLALVFLCLAFFLDLRLAFWTTLGIPISFAGGLLLMPQFGVTINMLSLFALIVVLGIVVDDAIVVGENVFAYRQQGMKPLDAAIAGAREMAGPVVIAVLTTIVAFMPLAFAEGMLGKILWPVPVVVITVLGTSLVEALWILPAHLSTGKKTGREHHGLIGRGQTLVRAGLQWWIDHPYLATLRWTIRWRYLTITLGVMLLTVTVGFIGGDHIKFEFMPSIDADNVWATVTMPQGTPVERTRGVLRKLEDAARETRRQLNEEVRRDDPDAPSIITHMSTTVGAQPFSAMAGAGPGDTPDAGFSGSHLGEINIELLKGERRNVSSGEVANRWRELAGEMPGASSLTFTADFFNAGEAINIELSHRNFDRLLEASERLKEKLAAFDGVTDIADDFEPGKLELQLSLRPEARTGGLTLNDLARQVRQAFYGEEVQRIQRGRNDVRVMVRYPEEKRRSLADIEQMRIRTPDGTEVPFETVAEVEEGRGYAVIRRADLRRVVSVTAEVQDDQANANEVNRVLNREVLPTLKADFPGLTYSFEGEQKEQADSLNSLVYGFAFALLAIYGLLAVQFKSYIQPLIVMSAIPFGLIGAVIGHVIMGFNLSMLSAFGLVALTGVVVNDSLIMIDLINRERASGVPLHQVLLDCGTRRFRPILLTTLTTFFGLMPMILEQSLQARFLIPMAISLGFGVVFATSITLILVPTLYMILEDVKAMVFTPEPQTSEAAPA